MLDVSDRLIVIVGGGAVAVRKAAGLLAAGARRVRVVSPTFHAQMPPDVQRLVEEYKPRHLDGAALVFAVTDSPAVNTAVARDAKALGVFVNRADAADAGDGDFVTPALHRDGAVTVMVSAAGSPAIAAKIRDQLREHLDPRWIALAEAMRALRPTIHAAPITPEARRALLVDLATEHAADLAMHEGAGGLRTWIDARVNEILST